MNLDGILHVFHLTGDWPESRCRILLILERQGFRKTIRIHYLACQTLVKHFEIFLSNLNLNISGCGSLWQASLCMKNPIYLFAAKKQAPETTGRTDLLLIISGWCLLFVLLLHSNRLFNRTRSKEMNITA